MFKPQTSVIAIKYDLKCFIWYIYSRYLKFKISSLGYLNRGIDNIVGRVKWFLEYIFDKPQVSDLHSKLVVVYY